MNYDYKLHMVISFSYLYIIFCAMHNEQIDWQTQKRTPIYNDSTSYI